MAREQRDGLLVRSFLQPQGPGDRRRNERPVRHRAEVDEVDPVREGRLGLEGDSRRQPRLTGPAGAGQREEPGLGETIDDLADLGGAADERRELGRQVDRRLEGAGCRELLPQAVDEDLPQPDGRVEVLEPMDAQVLRA